LQHPARRQLQAGWDFYLAVGDEQSPLGSDNILHIIFAELTRVWRLYRTVLSLCADGYGPEALVQVRPMYESNLVAFWAMRNPEEAEERFTLHLAYVNHLRAVADSEAHPDSLMLDDELDRAVKLFGRYGELPWSGKRPRELDADYEAFHEEMFSEERWPLAGFFNGTYRWLNWSLHGSPTNLMYVTRLVEEQRVYDAVPSDLDVHFALQEGSNQAILSYEQLTMLRGGIVSPRIKKLIFEIWRSNNPDSYTTGRNDPCPCGSGKKYKTCHLPSPKHWQPRGEPF
jgi:hypothetical protein